jgi:hypothetical protein
LGFGCDHEENEREVVERRKGRRRRYEIEACWKEDG